VVVVDCWVLEEEKAMRIIDGGFQAWRWCPAQIDGGSRSHGFL
jgi:hypothetical protein